MKEKTKIDLGSLSKKISETAGAIGNTANKVGGNIVEQSSALVSKVKSIDTSNLQFDTQDVLTQCMKLPIVKVDREKMLHKELIKYYSEDVVNIAINKNPAYAGIERSKIDEIAKQVINYETNKVSAISFAAGIPGGIAMAATVPADITQYFTFILRAMQKLAYLYGFDEFDFSEENVNDETMNEMLICLGVMFSVDGANKGIKIIADAATQKVAKSLANKALTKGTIYPIVKKIAQTVGIKMTKQIFAKSVSKIVPIVGGAVSGGLTYATFKPCCNKLKDTFSKLDISDPDFYKKDDIINESEIESLID